MTDLAALNKLMVQLQQAKEDYLTHTLKANEAIMRIEALLLPHFASLIPPVTEQPPKTEEPSPSPPSSNYTDWVFDPAWQLFTMLPNHTVVEGKRFAGLEHIGVGSEAAVDKTYVEGLVLRNCLVENAAMWGSRIQGAVDLTYDRVEFRNVEREHGIYVNVSHSSGTSLRITDCHFENIGAQAIQTVWRPGESPDASDDIAPGGVIHVERAHARHVGWNRDHGRASYAYTFGDLEGADRPVRMLDCVLENGSVGLNRGMVVVTERSWAELVGCSFKHSHADQTAGLFRGVKRLVLRECHFEASNPGDYDKVFIQNCDEVVIDNCSGNLPVYLDGILLGRIDGVRLA